MIDNTINNDLFDTYSDLYKDVNGFRPRGYTATRFMALSQEEAEAELKELDEQLDIVMFNEREVQIFNLLAFLEAMKQLSGNGRTSIQNVIFDEVKRADMDPEYVDYNWGLKYGTVRGLISHMLPDGCTVPL